MRYRLTAGSILAVALLGNCSDGSGPNSQPALVVIKPDSLTLCIGCSDTLSAEVRDSTGTVLSGRTIEWSTAAPQIASVSAAGVVTGLSTGVASIIASSSPAAADAAPVTVVTNSNPYALDFVNAWVTVPDDPDLDLAATWTIEAWIKPRDAGGTSQHIISKWGACTVASYSMEIRSGKLHSGIASCANGTQEVASSGSIVNDQWQHVAITLSAGTLRIYLNGALDTAFAGSQAPLNTTTDLSIGRQSVGGLVFDGLIDEVRIWTVARTAAQIAAAMNRRLRGNEAGLVGYWRFDEGSGDTAQDATGRGHNGQLGSAVGADANDPQWSTDRPPIL